MAGLVFVIFLGIVDICLIIVAVSLFRRVKKSGIGPILGEMAISRLSVKSGRATRRSEIGSVERPVFGTKLK